MYHNSHPLQPNPNHSSIPPLPPPSSLSRLILRPRQSLAARTISPSYTHTRHLTHQLSLNNHRPLAPILARKPSSTNHCSSPRMPLHIPDFPLPFPQHNPPSPLLQHSSPPPTPPTPLDQVIPSSPPSYYFLVRPLSPIQPSQVSPPRTTQIPAPKKKSRLVIPPQSLSVLTMLLKQAIPPPLSPYTQREDIHSLHSPHPHTC